MQFREGLYFHNNSWQIIRIHIQVEVNMFKSGVRKDSCFLCYNVVRKPKGENKMHRSGSKDEYDIIYDDE